MIRNSVINLMDVHIINLQNVLMVHVLVLWIIVLLRKNANKVYYVLMEVVVKMLIHALMNKDAIKKPHINAHLDNVLI